MERFTVVPAAYVILRKDNKVLLIRRSHTGYFDGWYSLPSGHIDGGEPAHQAAIREAKEEVGVDILEEDLKFAHVVHRVSEDASHERIDFGFEAVIWKGEPTNCEPDKCDDVAWFAEDNLPENTIPLVSQILKAVSKGEYYSENGFELP